MRARMPFRLLAVFTMALALGGAIAGSARTAHAEALHTAGDYQIAVTFARSPVYPNEPLEFQIRVTTLDGTPVEGLEQSLLLRVGVPNGVTETLALLPVSGRPGVYKVDLIFDRAGYFNMQVLGTINGQKVSESFLTGKDGLDKVIVKDDKVYPKGSGWVVAFTFGSYLAGLAAFGVHYLRRWRRQRAVTAH